MITGYVGREELENYTKGTWPNLVIINNSARISLTPVRVEVCEVPETPFKKNEVVK